MTCCPNCGHTDPLTDWNLSLDEGVFYRGKQVTTARQRAWTRILVTLGEARGSVVSPQALLNLAPNAGSHLVASQVHQLRKHLATARVPDPIGGMNGYRWEVAS